MAPHAFLFSSTSTNYCYLAQVHEWDRHMQMKAECEGATRWWCAISLPTGLSRLARGVLADSGGGALFSSCLSVCQRGRYFVSDVFLKTINEGYNRKYVCKLCVCCLFKNTFKIYNFEDKRCRTKIDVWLSTRVVVRWYASTTYSRGGTHMKRGKDERYLFII